MNYVQKTIVSASLAVIFAAVVIIAAGFVSSVRMGTFCFDNFDNSYHSQPSDYGPFLDDNGPGIGDYGTQALNNTPRPDDRQLGIGDYSEHA